MLSFMYRSCALDILVFYCLDKFRNMQDFRTACRWFEPHSKRIPSQDLMIETATGFIPVIVSTMTIWERFQWLWKYKSLTNKVRNKERNE